jgi:hypothetical protein
LFAWWVCSEVPAITLTTVPPSAARIVAGAVAPLEVANGAKHLLNRRRMMWWQFSATAMAWCGRNRRVRALGRRPSGAGVGPLLGHMGVYSRLVTRMVRNPRSPNWLHLLPRAILAPDLPVPKQRPTPVCDPPANDGLHLQGVLGAKPSGRLGNTRWRRLTEERAGSAKSVFHFDVQGSVAKSTHAGIPWLRFIRQRFGSRVHFWPFDGWEIPPGRSALAEVYPALWSRSFAKEGRTGDQHDAYCIAAWLSRADRNGSLATFLKPELTPPERTAAQVEGWILGVPGLIRERDLDSEGERSHTVH